MIFKLIGIGWEVHAVRNRYKNHLLEIRSRRGWDDNIEVDTWDIKWDKVNRIQLADLFEYGNETSRSIKCGSLLATCRITYF